MQGIKLGMLQAAKTKEIKAKQAGVSGAQIGKAEDIFTQYQNYKNQIENQGSAGESGSKLEVSPQQLENMMEETIQKFKEYYAVINESPDTSKNKNEGKPKEDDKNKIQQKNLGGLMA